MTAVKSLEDQQPKTEGWQSGRMYLTRNQAYEQSYRGFESHPFRHRINDLRARMHTGMGMFGISMCVTASLAISLADGQSPSEAPAADARSVIASAQEVSPGGISELKEV